MDHAVQLRKQSERFLHGYIFVPCCSEDYCPNQLERIQSLSSLYGASASSSQAMLPELRSANYETMPTTRYNPYRDADYPVLLSAIHTDRPQPYEVSRLKVDLERLPSTFRGSYFQAQTDWKMGLGCKPKRNRTIFTADQLERLEKEFERQQYIVGTERFYLAADLGLNETQVKVWFQNRRIKWRRQNLEA